MDGLEYLYKTRPRIFNFQGLNWLDGMDGMDGIRFKDSRMDGLDGLEYLYKTHPHIFKGKIGWMGWMRWMWTIIQRKDQSQDSQTDGMELSTVE